MSSPCGGRAGYGPGSSGSSTLCLCKTPALLPPKAVPGHGHQLKQYRSVRPNWVKDVGDLSRIPSHRFHPFQLAYLFSPACLQRRLGDINTQSPVKTSRDGSNLGQIRASGSLCFSLCSKESPDWLCYRISWRKAIRRRDLDEFPPSVTQREQLSGCLMGHLQPTSFTRRRCVMPTTSVTLKGNIEAAGKESQVSLLEIQPTEHEARSDAQDSTSPASTAWQHIPDSHV